VLGLHPTNRDDGHADRRAHFTKKRGAAPGFAVVRRCVEHMAGDQPGQADLRCGVACLINIVDAGSDRGGDSRTQASGADGGHGIGERERARCQLYAPRFGCQRDVEAVVYYDPRTGRSLKGYQFHGQVVESASGDACRTQVDRAASAEGPHHACRPLDEVGSRDLIVRGYGVNDGRIH
jgi:hypothetical protein